MPHFMLILYRTKEMQERLANFTDEDMQQAGRRYQEWAAGLQSRDQYLGGASLAPAQGKVLNGAAGEMQIMDGPFSETKELVGGYFLITADSYDHACEITRTCPQLGFGGAVEIRQVDGL